MEFGEEDDSNSSIGFTFVDFLPESRDRYKLTSSAVYEDFSTLVERANDWLREHRSWKVITCESVEFKSKYELRGEADFQKIRYLEYKNIATYYIRGLRLWMIKREKEADTPQQIGYRNLIPHQYSSGGLFGHPSYQTLDEVIKDINSPLYSDPIPGRVITVETQKMKLPYFGVEELDPDRSNWKEDQGVCGERFLFVIRVFYELMAGNPEEIGIKDFIPERVAKGCLFTLPKFEPFSDVVSEASDWCWKQQGLRICNAQCVEIKIKLNNESADTQKMAFKEHSERETYYLRILRVAYTRQRAADVSDVNPSNTGVAQLTCKTFEPVQLTTGGWRFIDYETLQQTTRRVTAWVKATGARVISAETSAMRIFDADEWKHGPEASFTYSDTTNDRWLFVLRLYLNGAYNEPPPDRLPPVPELQETNCCVIL